MHGCHACGCPAFARDFDDQLWLFLECSLSGLDLELAEVIVVHQSRDAEVQSLERLPTSDPYARILTVLFASHPVGVIL